MIRLSRCSLASEANQGGFHGGHGSVSNLPNLYAEGTNNPRGSIALFTPSDMYHRGVDEVKGGNPVSTADPDYMWMVAERENVLLRRNGRSD